ncbi:alpha/beta fold hydrolase [Enterobacter hormaechei]
MPGYGESPMLAVARANAGDYADALAAMLDRAGVWQAVLVGHSLGALVASAFAEASRIASFIWCWPTRRRGTAMPRRSSGSRSGATASSRWRWAKSSPRPAPRAAAPRRARGRYRHRRGGHAGAAPEGYLAASWMLAHDDIHGWLKRYSGSFEVWCGEQDAITQPELVQGLALRYGMPFIAIPQAGHASYPDNDAFFNQQLLRINEEVRDECTN